MAARGCGLSLDYIRSVVFSIWLSRIIVFIIVCLNFLLLNRGLDIYSGVCQWAMEEPKINFMDLLYFDGKIVSISLSVWC